MTSYDEIRDNYIKQGSEFFEQGIDDAYEIMRQTTIIVI